MRKMILIMIGTIVLSCSTDIYQDEPILENNETVKFDQDIETVSDVIFYDNEASGEATKEWGSKTGVSNATAERKGNGNGNTGKPQNVIMFKPSIANNLRTALNGRIIIEPVEYLGALPTEQTIDFDNDGILDEVTLVKRCYMPRTFVEVLVNGVVVSYQVVYESLAAGGVQIVGYTDADGDGFTDIIFEGGNPRDYNNGEAYSPYNVGYNRPGAGPIPLKDIMQSLVVISADSHSDYIKWDLSAFKYKNTVFHVKFWNESRNDGYAVQQTHTYDDGGFYIGKNRIIAGDLYVMSFTNLGENCTSIEVRFIGG